jgi:predicted GNAT family N-acyltransferase
MTVCADVDVQRITATIDREAAFEIRRQVFLVEQKVPADEEFDEYDEGALHVLARAGGVAAGTGRLIVEADHARIGRMAVLASHRERGVGRAILEELLRAATERGARRIVLHAQVHAIGFYERLGFRATGPEFEEAGIPHRVMERRLPSDPPPDPDTARTR